MCARRAQSLVEQYEAKSAALGRNARFSKQSTISSLPPFLMVQFVRFFWKADTKKKAKIMRVSRSARL